MNCFLLLLVHVSVKPVKPDQVLLLDVSLYYKEQTEVTCRIAGMESLLIVCLPC